MSEFNSITDCPFMDDPKQSMEDYNMQKNKTFKIYWIFDAATDNNVMTQGYVGITTQSITKRLRSHMTSTHSGQANSPTNTKRHMIDYLENCIDPQVVEICRTSNEAMACKIEEMLRPTANIGQNRYKGGKRNGVQRPIICITEDGTKIEYVSQSEAGRDGFNTGGIHYVLNGKCGYTTHPTHGRCSFTYKK